MESIQLIDNLRPLTSICGSISFSRVSRGRAREAETRTSWPLCSGTGNVNALRAWRRNQGSGVRGQEEWQFVIAGWDQGGHRAELEQLCRELGVSAAGVSVEEFLTSREPCAPLGKSATVMDAPLQASIGRDEAVPPCRTSDLRHPTSVVFTGPAFGQAKDALLRRADAFILPSFSEGLPMSVLEAWAYGLPVLMTEQCNIPEDFAAGAALRIGTEVGDQKSEVRGQRSEIRSRRAALVDYGGYVRVDGNDRRGAAGDGTAWPQAGRRALHLAAGGRAD